MPLYNFGPDSTFGFDEFFNSSLGLMTSGFVSNATSTSFEITDGVDTVTLTGVGFTYTFLGGMMVLNGGLIDTMSVDRLGTTLGQATGLNLLGATLSSALTDEFFAFNPFALENLFLTQDWTFNGTSGVDELLATDLTGDGVEYAPSGNDYVDLGDDHDVFYSGAGNDTIEAGNGRDTIDGGSGNDSLMGGNDTDEINGGSGNDYLDGGRGHDVMNGGADDDYLTGGKGSDVMDGGTGNDTLIGGKHNDYIQGGDDNDNLTGDHGNDTLEGGTGNDTINGGKHKDTLEGGAGDDVLIGGHQDDLMSGGADNDVLDGGTHNDTLDGGSGDDTLTGGSGADTFVFDNTSGTDLISDYDFTEDRVEINGTLFFNANIVGDDVVLSHSGGTVTLEDVQILHAGDFTDLVASIDVFFL